MLFAVSGLIGCPVKASDGPIGVAKDFLFDDQSWKVRWMTVDTHHWLPGRHALIHPSAIAPVELPPKPALPMMSFGETLTVSVGLTKQQIEASPELREDEPVTRDLQARLHDHYGLDPYWADTYFGPDAIDPLSKPIVAETATPQTPDMESDPGDGDPHLRSVAEVVGYQVHATDGDLGPVENILADDVNWDIRYLVVGTRHWLPGKLAPYAVTDIDRRGRRVSVNVTRDQVKSAPAWDPVAMADGATEEQLRRHFGWPGHRS